ncbi:MAG: acyl-CoA dehydrogenase family protein [Thermomicrobiales bacterium]|nr:acyl-CoA dehydrogenase family protein [Thermomicrobiales bacterium]MCO5221005.1 acyl-CoA dehydrogenase family protein [Thermomicrobiales bacterium]
MTDFYQVDSLLTPDERAVRDRVRTWARERLAPRAGDFWERGEFQADRVLELGELGIVGGIIGAYGCPSISSAAYGLASQELAYADSSFTTFFGVHSGLAMGSIALFGTEEQKQRWLPPMARCEVIGAFALTEPEHGSDAAHLETVAAPVDGGYRLNGGKRWIGNGDNFGVAVLWAQTPDGIAPFLFEPDTDGFSRTPMRGKLAKRGVTNVEMTFANCFVPESHRMPVAGFRNVAEILRITRHHVSWTALGEAIACYEAALAHARQRVQFGKPIGSFQLVQEKLVEMATEITKAQLLSLQLSRLLDAGNATAGMTAMAKANNSKIARDCARLAREILGGDGILLQNDVIRHMLDIEAIYTFEGTWDINTLIAGRELTGLSAFG